MTRLSILEASWSERPVTMRLPFQFGSTEVRRTAEAHASVMIEVDGDRETGEAAQLMVPRWFDKRARMTNDDTIEELRETVRTAVARAPGIDGTALSIGRELRADVASALSDTPNLAAGFGPSLIEMAVIDALCRAKGAAFWSAAKADLFGLATAAPKDLSAEDITNALSRIGPPDRIAMRHTIGFDAPLRVCDVAADAPDDGLPVALEDVIAKTGIRGFKIKLKGDPDADLARLAAIAAVIDAVPGYSATLDANEQYEPEPFADLLAGFRADPACDRLYRSTRFVEQPFPREIALSGPVSADLPLVIDESDSAEDVFPTALALGWSGTSIKSCKGVLRALLNKARADAAGAILSGEDLTCQPGLCWQQDTAMMAACNVKDVERNGHHFAGGMQGISDAERRRFLENHPDIYTEVNGGIALRIDGGDVGIASLDAPGFASVALEGPA
ncbi:MAG: mandelate racemase [Pseudomonadota bacterium]